MSRLPSDWPSFLWGLVAGSVAAFATGFLKKAGEQAFSWLTEKISPKPPEPVQVSGKFVPTRFAPGTCAWVNEIKLYEYEEKGYTYYPHPRQNARCFRITSDGRQSVKEFLLVEPGSKEIAGGLRSPIDRPK